MEKQGTKKSKIYIFLMALPILIGIVLYVTYCSLTPNYQWIYNNEIVHLTDLNEVDSYLYKINDENNCITPKIENLNDSYTSNKKEEEIFLINLEKLNNLNNAYHKLILNFSIEAKVDEDDKASSYMKLFIDDKLIKTIALSSSATEYNISSINFKNFAKLVVSRATYTKDENSAIPIVNFKDLKIKVLGA